MTLKILLLTGCFTLASIAWGQTMCPDGSEVSGNTGCEMAPNGSFVQRDPNGQAPMMAPNGSFIAPGTNGLSPQMAPNGQFIQGGGNTTMCPDGSFVQGSCHMAPNGDFVGGK